MLVDTLLDAWHYKDSTVLVDTLLDAWHYKGSDSASGYVARRLAL